jgi:hypothetical protein
MVDRPVRAVACSGVAFRFEDRRRQMDWRGQKGSVNVESCKGALHDTWNGERVLTFLTSLSCFEPRVTLAYMTSLRNMGIPSVVRAGSDLFSQPEVPLLTVLDRKR